MLLQKLFIFFAADLVAHHGNSCKPDFRCELVNVAGGIYTTTARFHHDDKFVYSRSGSSSQVFNPRFHIHDYDFVSCQDNVCHQSS